MWVAIGGLAAFLACGVLCGILTYFLFPREVAVSMATPFRDDLMVCPNSTSEYCPDPDLKQVLMNLTLPLTISNDNYAKINITKAVYTVMHDN